MNEVSSCALRSFCGICCVVVRKVNNRQHILSHLSNKCPKCNFMTMNEHMMIQHLQSHLLDWFECLLCGDIYPTAATFKLHVQQHRRVFVVQNVRYQCSVCNENITTTLNDVHLNLEQHEQRHLCGEINTNVIEIKPLENNIPTTSQSSLHASQGFFGSGSDELVKDVKTEKDDIGSEKGTFFEDIADDDDDFIHDVDDIPVSFLPHVALVDIGAKVKRKSQTKPKATPTVRMKSQSTERKEGKCRKKQASDNTAKKAVTVKEAEDKTAKKASSERSISTATASDTQSAPMDTVETLASGDETDDYYVNDDNDISDSISVESEKFDGATSPTPSDPPLSSTNQGGDAGERSSLDSKPSNKKKIYTCDYCDTNFSSKAKLQEHTKREHSDILSSKKTEKYSCEKCYKEFTYKAVLNRHLKKDHGDNVGLGEFRPDEPELKFRCKDCGKGYTSPAGLLYHRRSKHGVLRKGQREPAKKEVRQRFSKFVSKFREVAGTDNYQCPICKKNQANNSRLKRHIANVHARKGETVLGMKDIYDPTIVCRVCKMEFHGFTARHEHIKTAHPDEFKEEELEQSITEALKDNTLDYNCRECGKEYDHPASMEKHKKDHENPHECKVCHSTCLTLRKLQRHMNVNRCHVCETCGFRFLSKHNLRTHQLVHTGEHPHLCNECGRSFRWEVVLTDHMKSHRGEKNHICKICSKAFVTSSALGAHMRMHSDNRPHLCTVCGKGFKFPIKLREHMRIHNGEKFDCPLCDRQITSASNLKKHLQVHAKRGETMMSLNNELIVPGGSNSAEPAAGGALRTNPCE